MSWCKYSSLKKTLTPGKAAGLELLGKKLPETFLCKCIFACTYIRCWIKYNASGQKLFNLWVWVFELDSLSVSTLDGCHFPQSPQLPPAWQYFHQTCHTRLRLVQLERERTDANTCCIKRMNSIKINWYTCFTEQVAIFIFKVRTHLRPNIQLRG